MMGSLETSAYTQKNLGLPLLMDKHAVTFENKSSSELNLTVALYNESPFKLNVSVLFTICLEIVLITLWNSLVRIKICSLQKPKPR